jgi:hypothetical protein
MEGQQQNVSFGGSSGGIVPLARRIKKLTLENRIGI